MDMVDMVDMNIRIKGSCIDSFVIANVNDTADFVSSWRDKSMKERRKYMDE